MIFCKYLAVKHYLTWHEAFYSLSPFSVYVFVVNCITIHVFVVPGPTEDMTFLKLKERKEGREREGETERESKEGRKEGEMEGKKKGGMEDEF